MFPYYILFLNLFFLGFFNVFKCGNKEINKSFFLIYLIFPFFYFIFFTGFKGNVGCDYNQYVELYNKLGARAFSGFIEPAYWMLMYISNLLHFSFETFWFIISFITITLTFIFFLKLSPYFIISLLIYLSGLFIERDFDGIRQGLSISFAYMGLLFLLNKKNKMFFLLTLCATLFHYSSIVFFISPLLIKKVFKKTTYLTVLFIGIIFVLLHGDIISILSKFIRNGYIAYKIKTYSASEEFGSVMGLKLGIIIRIMIFLFFLKTESFNTSKNKLLLNGFFIAIISSLFFNNIEIFGHRLVYGFREFQIIIIPILFYHLKEKLFLYPIISLYSLIMLLRSLWGPNQNYYIYKTILWN